ncbi:hypothetical protein EDD18DRAFT_1409006 [Armillaria luteobubalina]|uniref:Transmembrane protein n=1 Tax=Armillaria luteobubalina TaxID=153913 RepID=A0AA39PXW5_9AGAR|nr:hypothetical protein EDD18DRAFT_1409006 [Armillaria luteobubalina]
MDGCIPVSDSDGRIRAPVDPRQINKSSLPVLQATYDPAAPIVPFRFENEYYIPMNACVKTCEMHSDSHIDFASEDDIQSVLRLMYNLPHIYCIYEIFHTPYGDYEPFPSTPRQKPPDRVIHRDATPHYFVSASQGFHFEDFEGNVTAGIPITLSWLRNVDDPNQMDFQLRNTARTLPPVDSSFSLTNLTQLSGTTNVTFPKSGGHVIDATFNQTTFPATTQTFGVTPLPAETAIVSVSVKPLPSSVTETGQPPSSPSGSAQSTVIVPMNLNSTHRSRRAPIIIGAVIGSLLALLLLFGHHLSGYPKMVPGLNSYSLPVGNRHNKIISPMLADEMAPDVGTGSLELVEGGPQRNGIEVDDGEQRSNIATPVHNNISEGPSPRGENLQSPLDDVGAEVLRLRDQVLQLVERVQGNAFDPPPAYAST